MTRSTSACELTSSTLMERSSILTSASKSISAPPLHCPAVGGTDLPGSDAHELEELGVLLLTEPAADQVVDRDYADHDVIVVIRACHADAAVPGELAERVVVLIDESADVGEEVQTAVRPDADLRNRYAGCEEQERGVLVPCLLARIVRIGPHPGDTGSIVGLVIDIGLRPVPLDKTL